MKTKYLNLAIAFIVIITMSACKKDQSNPQESKNDPSTKILAFKNMEEYQQTLKEVSSLSSDERVAWEDAKGFKSFGRVCDEIYSKIKPEEFRNSDEIKTFVSKNSDYIQLVKGDDGEFSVESKLNSNSFRYLVNCDKLFQIGTDSYKVFESAIVSCKNEQIVQLKAMNETNISSFERNPSFSITHLGQVTILKSTDDLSYNCGTSDGYTKTNGTDRTSISISVQQIDMPPVTQLYCTYLVKPQHKSIFWFNCTRTISASIKVRIDHYNWGGANSGTWNNELFTIYEPGKLLSQLSGEFINVLESANGQPVAHNAHFGGYNCWGSTPSAGPATIGCNTFLVN